jgi:tRNA uridine 5-carboxymethylaminomethyl modification enzyme
LRIDNADERLTPVGRRVGLATGQRWDLFRKKQEQKARLTALMSQSRADPEKLKLALDDRPTLIEWLKRPQANAGQLKEWAASSLDEQPLRGVLENIETQAKYSGYIAQQERQIERLKNAESRCIPDDFRFAGIPGLSREVRDKLERVRPRTLGQAGRIPGVTPAAIAVLDVYLSVAKTR